MECFINYLNNNDGLIALFSLIISVITMGIFAGTLWLTRKYAISTENIVKETEKSIKVSQEIAAANIKPLLNIVPTKISAKEKGIKLINYGLGSAIINNIKFTKNNIQTSNIGEFFNLITGVKYDSHYSFPNSGKSFIKPGEEKKIIWLSEDYLIKQNKDSIEREKIFSDFTNAMSEVNVEIIYEDLFGNEQIFIKKIF